MAVFFGSGFLFASTAGISITVLPSGTLDSVIGSSSSKPKSIAAASSVSEDLGIGLDGAGVGFGVAAAGLLVAEGFGAGAEPVEEGGFDSSASANLLEAVLPTDFNWSGNGVLSERPVS